MKFCGISGRRKWIAALLAAIVVVSLTVIVAVVWWPSRDSEADEVAPGRPDGYEFQSSDVAEIEDVYSALLAAFNAPENRAADAIASALMCESQSSGIFDPLEGPGDPIAGIRSRVDAVFRDPALSAFPFGVRTLDRVVHVDKHFGQLGGSFVTTLIERVSRIPAGSGAAPDGTRVVLVRAFHRPRGWCVSSFEFFMIGDDLGAVA